MNKQDLRSVILEYLFRNGSFSRPEIVEITGMRPGTVFDEVNQLKQQGCILEPARAGKYTGRKAPALTLNPDYLWTAGIDFQVHRTIGVVTDFTGQIQYSAEVSAIARKNLTGCRNEVREILQQLHAKTGSHWEKIRGIGFADPGLVDVSSGKSIRAVQVPGWEDIETGKWLAEENRSSGYLFLNRYGEKITVRGISQQLKNYADKYGLDKKVVYPHSFRHRYAKNFLEKFNDIALLADLMGHESIETTRIYLRRTASEQQALVDKIVTW